MVILGKLRPMVTLALKSEKIMGPVSLKIFKVSLDQDPSFLDEKSRPREKQLTHG